MYEGDQWLNGTTVTTPWISSWVISEVRIAPHLVCCTTWGSCRQSLLPATSYSVWPDNVLQLGLKSKRWKALHKSWLYLGPAAHPYYHSLRFMAFLMSLCCCSDTEASCLSRLLQSKPSAVVLWHSCTEVKDSMAWLRLTYIPSYSVMWAVSCWHFSFPLLSHSFPVDINAMPTFCQWIHCRNQACFMVFLRDDVEMFLAAVGDSTNRKTLKVMWMSVEFGN